MKKYSKNPPMGWNSWDCYGSAVNEEQLLGNAKYMYEKLKEYGYEYIVCDIQWSEPLAGTEGWEYRPFAKLCLDDYGRQLPAVNRFPSSKNNLGFKPIADEIHSMGLKFGIHIMRGVPRLAVHNSLKIKDTNITCDQIASSNSICKWNTDMYGIDMSKDGAQEYYNSIFELYAGWGVDFVKVDDICNTNLYSDNPYSGEKEIEAIKKAIDNCGREMILSLSPGPAVIEKSWHLKEYADMWRMSDDFWDDWGLLKKMFDYCEIWQSHVGLSSYPDCDMLPVGKICITGDKKGRMTNFTKDEQVTMMNLWSIFRSPLIIGAEMRDNDEWTEKLLANKDLLRLNKHSYGARQIARDDEKIIWKSFDEDGSVYLAIFNISETAISAEIPIMENIYDQCKLFDIWTKETSLFKDKKFIMLKPHQSAMYKINIK